MTKLLALLLLAVMALHAIKPIGIYGLRRRGDVWKIAALALGLMVLATLLRG